MNLLPLIFILSSPLRAAGPLITAPQAPAHIHPLIPSFATPITPLGAPFVPAYPLHSLPLITPLSLTPSLAPTALQAVPLLAAAVDSKIPAEAAAANGEKLFALLQDRDPLLRAKLAEVVPGVLHMKFPSQRLMASTMLRFQEHYESPKYRGKAFTLDEFKVWYASTKSHGHFSYYKDWGGFNIPSRVLRRFKKGDFDPLDAKERALLARVKERKGRFYLIATAGKDGDPVTLRHEVAHGLWYTRPEYRRRAQAILRGLDLKPVFKMLKDLGYHKSVWLDEAHAWLGDPSKYIRAEGVNPKPYAAARRRLLALQKEYVSGIF